jgi:cysteine-rich repeat protein
MLDRASRPLRWLLLLAVLLAFPAGTRAQDTCDVVVALADPGPLPLLAYGIDYSAAGGSFVGRALTPVCTELFPAFENTVFDDDVGMLSDFIASHSGAEAPQALLSCVFALDGGFPCPDPTAFVVTAPAFPPFELLELHELFPDLPPPPALAITVTPRTPVCGDGFREGNEACDDGNTADGDCCSSTCGRDPAGTACADGDVCTLNESCDAAGHCVPTSTLACADADPCTTDTCHPGLGCVSTAAPAPLSVCVWDHRAALDLRDRAPGAPNTLGWQWRSTRATTAAAVGDPTVDTAYALCLYDEVAGSAALAARVDVPAGAGWRMLGTSGSRFEYKDRAGSADGVERVRVDGKPNGVKLQLKAAKAGLVLPGPVAPDRYFVQDGNVFAQLRNTAGGCWSVRFGDAVVNDPARFKAKAK